MRVSTVVLTLSCLVTGSALVGTRVKAFDDVSPARRLPTGIGIGNHVIMSFAGPKNIDCTIARVDAGWVRCAAPPHAPLQADDKHVEVWYDLAHVDTVWKVDTQR